MSLLLLAISWAIACIVVCALQLRYENKRTCPWYVRYTVFFGWLFPFSLIFLLPIDISSARYTACLEAHTGMANPLCRIPFAFVPSTIIRWTWNIAYWNTFVLTWTLIPFLQGCVSSGEFTFWKKCRDSLHSNFLFYAASAAALGFLAVYLWIGTSYNTLPSMTDFMMAAANAWGLLLIIVFLGYGLVEVPRYLWRSSHRRAQLCRLERRAPVLREELAEAEADLTDLIAEVQSMSERTRYQPELHEAVDYLLNTTPLPSQGGDEHFTSTVDRIVSGKPVDMKYLVQLNCRIRDAIADRDRLQSIWRKLLKRAFKLQDVLSNQNNPNYLWASSLYQAKQPIWKRRLLWFWHVKVDVWARRLLCVICACMSLVILWSETSLIFTATDLSIINRLTRWERMHPFAIEFLTFVIILYMAICAYSSFMKVRIFSFYRLVPNNHTDEKSLLFFAAYFCRLTFPLGYNFLTLVEGSTSERAFITEFSKVMGQINLIPLLGKNFNLYMPLGLAVICIMVLFKLHGFAASLFCLSAYSDSEHVLDIDDAEDLLEGRELISYARRMEERNRANSIDPSHNDSYTYLNRHVSLSASDLSYVEPHHRDRHFSKNRLAALSDASLPTRLPQQLRSASCESLGDLRNSEFDHRGDFV